MLVDSHAHLNFKETAGNLSEELKNARGNGVQKIVCVGTNLDDSKAAVEIAKKEPDVFATVGVHPGEESPADWGEFEKLIENPKTVAIGECGLDYSRIKGPGERSGQNEMRRQRELFQKQIELARKHDLPLVIHVRDAYQEIMDNYGEILQEQRGVFHCFSGTPEYADFVLRQLPGFYLSFAGNVTFKNAQDVRDLAKLVPIGRLLVETDSPFLAPEPIRGSRNSPVNVRIVAQRLAEIKNIPFGEMAEATTKNAKNLFGLDRHTRFSSGSR